MRFRFSHLAVSRAECAKYMQNEFKQRDRLPLSQLYRINFLTMTDISSHTSQHLIGRLLYYDTELWYFLTSAYGHVDLHLTSKTEPNVAHIELPLSMDKRTPNSIYVPPAFSKHPGIIPNEVTWEFLNQVYSSTKFPTL